MLLPGQTIGIIGGGQLGRMLALAAARLGLKIIVLDPHEDAPAFQCATTSIIAPYDDIAGLQELVSKADVVTYEFENVSAQALESAGAESKLCPNLTALRTSQDRLVEKNFFRSQEIATAPFHDVADEAALNRALDTLNGKGLLKTRRFGYDGKGQVRLGTGDGKIMNQARELIGAGPCILEGLVEFEREISVIAARNASGQVECFDPAENLHREGILRSSTVPAHVSDETAENAKAITARVLDTLDYIGVIGIEFFVLPDGSLIANEFAPRVHNSGHWTEAACTISQFEQHIRAIAGWPLGNTCRHSNCRMENLIGDEIRQLPELAKQANTMVHHYGKSEIRDGRKMGHITKLLPSSQASA